MHATTDRLEFAPPALPGLARALLLAIVVHSLLLTALTWGVRWNRDTQMASIEAELWSTLPVAAAPARVEPPPEPPPVPAPKPLPAPPEPEPAPPPKLPQVDIALQQEKLRLKKQEEQQQKKAKQDKLKQDQRKLAQEQQKQEKFKQAQAEKAQKVAAEKKKIELEAKQLEAQREKNLARLAGMAGATGAPNATGVALKSAGPSASYAGKIRASIKPNIVFTEELSGNPTAEIEVRTSPDGTIVGRKLLKPSGLKAWDEAVLKAIDRTEVLPRDTDGSVPAALILVFRPKD